MHKNLTKSIKDHKFQSSSPSFTDWGSREIAEYFINFCFLYLYRDRETFLQKLEVLKKGVFLFFCGSGHA